MYAGAACCNCSSSSFLFALQNQINEPRGAPARWPRTEAFFVASCSLQLIFVFGVVCRAKIALFRPRPNLGSQVVHTRERKLCSHASRCATLLGRSTIDVRSWRCSTYDVTRPKFASRPVISAQKDVWSVDIITEQSEI